MSKYEKPPHPCQVCGGTGFLTLRRSWFPADGFYRERCHICKGTKVHPFMTILCSWATEQKKLREEAKAHRQGTTS